MLLQGISKVFWGSIEGGRGGGVVGVRLVGAICGYGQRPEYASQDLLYAPSM